jgi:peptidoglycan hydrolase-like protein with peptidoglycan-binding domain
MSGADVRILQQKLQELGYLPGLVDGVYGPATAGAVRAFQRAVTLDDDGVVGDATITAMYDGSPLVASPLTVGSIPGRAALALASTFIGVRETPSDSNNQQFGEWFGANGCPWCNIFVSFCFYNGAHYLICRDFNADGVSSKGCAYVPSTLAWLTSRGMWVGHAPPLPGDIVIYDFGKGPHHIGIVDVPDAGGYFWAVEGNTSQTNESNGGEVMRRHRHLSQTVGFGRPF